MSQIDEEDEFDLDPINEAAEQEEEREQLKQWEDHSDSIYTFLQATLDEKQEVVRQYKRDLEEARKAAEERA